jgi:cytoskeletal protein CcmA (bactofilin family)
METITDKIEGDLLVTEMLNIRGMVTGSVTVTSNGTLNLYGMICGNLILEPNSNTVVHGMVNGNVLNQGGFLSVLGRVVGVIQEITNSSPVSTEPTL